MKGTWMSSLRAEGEGTSGCKHVTHPPLLRRLIGDFRVGDAWAEVRRFTSRLYDQPRTARQRQYSNRREAKLRIYHSLGRRGRLVQVFKD